MTICASRADSWGDMQTVRGSGQLKMNGPLPEDVKRPAALDGGFRGEKMEASKPIAKFSAGQVSCALWENEIRKDDQTMNILKASVSKNYKNRAGNWQTSGSFSRNEIPLAIHCLQKAFERMLKKSPEDEINSAIEEVRVI